MYVLLNYKVLAVGRCSAGFLIGGGALPGLGGESEDENESLHGSVDSVNCKSGYTGVCNYRCEAGTWVKKTKLVEQM